jgi:hypothetical protein
MKKIGMKRRIGRAPSAKSMMPSAMKMEAPRKMLAEGMKSPKIEGPMAPAIPGFKKGGKVKKSDIVGAGKTPAAARSDYEKKMKKAGMKPLPPAKKPKMGLGIMIILGKKKGK